MDNYDTLNHLLVELFRDIMNIEEKAVITPEFKDITNNDMHIIEAIGRTEQKNMSAIAKSLSVTVGTLTIAINNLVKKGYLTKVQSREDKREYHLRVTQKYLDYYNISYQYMDTVLQRMEERFSPEELEILVRMLKVMDEELMSEIQI